MCGWVGRVRRNHPPLTGRGRRSPTLEVLRPEILPRCRTWFRRRPRTSVSDRGETPTETSSALTCTRGRSKGTSLRTSVLSRALEVPGDVFWGVRSDRRDP